MEHAALFNPYENKPTALNCSSKLRMLTGLAKATVSYHLQVLKDADLIYPLRKGKFKYLFPKEATLKSLGSIGSQLLARYKNASAISCGFIKRPKRISLIISFLELSE